MSMSAATILTGIKGNTGRAGYITGFLIYVCLGYLLASVRQSPIPNCGNHIHGIHPGTAGSAKIIMEISSGPHCFTHR
jgi:hypothetical protein